jgi:PncC family amidohydrolase
VAHQARREAKDHLLSTPDDVELPELATHLQDSAVRRSLTVATAESCTGGLIGHSITAVAGSSAYYLGGVVSYSDDVKTSLLHVSTSTLDRHGAVSAQVAVAMAEGVRGVVGAEFGVSVTGVAGPDGGTEAKPVGLTYVAAAGPDSHRVRRFVWSGDRTANKERSAAAALELLIELIEAAPLELDEAQP